MPVRLTPRRGSSVFLVTRAWIPDRPGLCTGLLEGFRPRLVLKTRFASRETTSLQAERELETRRGFQAGGGTTRPRRVEEGFRNGRLLGRRVRVGRSGRAREWTAASGSRGRWYGRRDQVSSSDYRSRLCAFRGAFVTQLGEVEKWQPEP